MKEKILYCIVGRTGSGKTTIANALAKKTGMVVVKSYTDREPREGETEENSDHIFISKQKITNMVEYDKGDEKIAAYTEINGIRYCTTTKILRQSDIYVIDPQGLQDLKANIGGEFKLIVFYIEAPEEIRRKRFISRGGTKEEFDKRDESEGEQFDEFERLGKMRFNLTKVDNSSRGIHRPLQKIMSFIAPIRNNN